MWGPPASTRSATSRPFLPRRPDGQLFQGAHHYLGPRPQLPYAPGLGLARPAETRIQHPHPARPAEILKQIQDLGKHLQRDLSRQAGQQPGCLLILSRQAPVQSRADVLECPQPPSGGVYRGDGLHGGAAGRRGALHPGPLQPASDQLPGRVLANGSVQVNPPAQFPQHIGRRPPIAAQPHLGGRGQRQQGPVGVDVPWHLADPVAGRIAQVHVQACRPGHSHHRGWDFFSGHGG